MTAKDFAQYIQRARPHQGYWLGCCPAHDDQHESLSWKDGVRDVIAKCHAGCTWAQIRAAAHLPSNGNDPLPTVPRTLVASYNYVDTDGTILYQVRRYEPKDFRPYRPSDKGGWVAGLGQVKHVVYHLPDLVGESEVWWVEGEKDADRLCSLGFMASTSQGGVSNWRPEYAQQLVEAGVRTLIIIPDNDDPGRTYATQVADAVTGRGLEARIISLPGVPLKGDVSDWLDAGATAEDLRHQADQAPVYTSVDPPTFHITRIGEDYRAELGPAVIHFRSVTQHHDGPSAIVEFRVGPGGRPHTDRLSLLSSRSRSSLAKTLLGRWPHEPWPTLLDDACHAVDEHLAQGEPSVALEPRAPTVADIDLVEGLIPLNQTTVLFADGASLKSYFALALSVAALRNEPLVQAARWSVLRCRSVLYLDWETGQDVQERRLWRLCQGLGIDKPSGLYYRSMRGQPLHASVQSLANQCARQGTDLIIVDSLGFACGDEPETAIANLRTLGALSTLPGTKLVLAHVNAQTATATNGPGRPYGSVFIRNIARSAIEARAEPDGQYAKIVTYYLRKANEGPDLEPAAIRYEFQPGGALVMSPAHSDPQYTSPIERVFSATSDEWKNSTTLSEESGLSLQETAVYLRRLERNQRVERDGEGGRGRGRSFQWRRRDRKSTE